MNGPEKRICAAILAVRAHRDAQTRLEMLASAGWTGPAAYAGLADAYDQVARAALAVRDAVLAIDQPRGEA